MENFLNRVDSELLPGLSRPGITPGPTTPEELVLFRSRIIDALPPFDASTSPVVRTIHHGPGIALWSYTAQQDTLSPAIYWLHGGGMIAGGLLADEAYCTALAEGTGCVVVAADYRLAPEHPHPTPVEDAYAGLEWMVTNASMLGIDPHRIAVGGSSAGGGLAAALALMARDRGGPAIAFQYLMYPMLDDRQESPSSVEFTAIPTWSRERNEFAWRCLLGEAAGTDDVSPYAAPSRAEDLTRLPPALIQVGELDLFRDENIAYATRLLQAGIPTELQVYPGAYHGFESVNPTASMSIHALETRNAAVIRALAP